MSQFFFTIVADAYNYDNKKFMKEMYALKLDDMKRWCEEQLDLSEVPNSYFRKCFLDEMFGGDSDTPYRLWGYIQQMCCPEDDEDEEEEDR